MRRVSVITISSVWTTATELVSVELAKYFMIGKHYCAEAIPAAPSIRLLA